MGAIEETIGGLIPVLVNSTLSAEIEESTLTTTVATTASVAIGSSSSELAVIEETMTYVESLTDEQLEELSTMLEEITQEETLETTKVYSK